MFAVLSILLTTLPLSLSVPMCQNPPPPPSIIPNLTDCQHLVSTILAISKLQHDRPILWSQYPSSFVRSRKLPYSFTENHALNDCEFIVDALYEGAQDAFPTKLVGEMAGAIIENCMERGVEGAETLGAVAVGRKQVIALILVKKAWTREGVSEGLIQLNLTNARLSRLGSRLGRIPSLVEDG